MTMPDELYCVKDTMKVGQGIPEGLPGYPHVLLLSGTGRNCGKTTAACRLIHKVRDEGKVIAVKISPHFHGVDYPASLAEKCGDYVIYPENRTDRPKDSSRMLAAGAASVYYIQARNECLLEAWSALSSWLEPGTPTIVEAGGLRQLIDPGVSLLLRHKEQQSRKDNTTGAYTMVITGMQELDSTIKKINFRNGGWMID